MVVMIHRAKGDEKPQRVHRIPRRVCFMCSEYGIQGAAIGMFNVR
jgi:hypothetical protein